MNQPAMRYSLRVGGDRLCDLPSQRQALQNGHCIQTESGLAVTQAETGYPEFTATEWVLRLENRAGAPSPLLSRIHPLDMVVAPQSGGGPFPNGYEPGGIAYTDFMLHYFDGSHANAHDYAPLTQRLGRNGARHFVLSAKGGRSSNGHMPFFNLQNGPESGVFFAVGWSGQWQVQMDIHDGAGVRVRAGMEDGCFRLEPGEAVRTPSVVMMEWKGPLEESWNRWRRFLRAHKSPDLAGAPCAPRTWANSWFNYDCGYGVNEANQLDCIDDAARLGVEFLVIDAGWYDCPHPYWWDGVGNWERPRRDAFPRGFAPLFARARERGVGFGVWFEFERASIASRVVREHPDWVLGATADWTVKARTVGVEHTSCLLNLGRRDVQDWILGLVDAYVREGMAWLRHDFNDEPLEVWRHADAPERQGISEIRYIEGLYRIYDEIRRRHPALLIEGCASGGRRIDVEIIARNHGYWASDLMCGTPEPMQAHINAFNHILLPHWHHTVLRDGNAPRGDTPEARYRFFSFLGGGPCVSFDCARRDMDRALVRRWMEMFRQVRHLTEGDYYALTACDLSLEAWSALQFNRPDMGEGLVAFFRRPASPYHAARFAMHGLDERADYEFRSLLDEDRFILSGADLRGGMDVTLPACPDVRLMSYRRRDTSPSSQEANR